jgi:hypothetical protein
LAHTFPEDGQRIIAALRAVEQQELSAVEASRPRKPSGGSRDATPPVRVTRVGGSPVVAAAAPDCPDCPGTALTGQHRNPAPDVSHLVTRHGVLKNIGTDAGVLTAHAKGIGINIGRSTKAATIANKIAYYYRGINEAAPTHNNEEEE